MKGFIPASIFAIIGILGVLYSKNGGFGFKRKDNRVSRRLGLLHHNAKFRDPKIVIPKLLSNRPRLAIVTFGILDHDKPRQNYKAVPPAYH